jgi:hypothetical protein
MAALSCGWSAAGAGSSMGTSSSGRSVLGGVLILPVLQGSCRGHPAAPWRTRPSY